jgi:hypothetical protein
MNVWGTCMQAWHRGSPTCSRALARGRHLKRRCCGSCWPTQMLTGAPGSPAGVGGLPCQHTEYARRHLVFVRS